MNADQPMNVKFAKVTASLTATARESYSVSRGQELRMFQGAKQALPTHHPELASVTTHHQAANCRSRSPRLARIAMVLLTENAVSARETATQMMTVTAAYSASTERMEKQFPVAKRPKTLSWMALIFVTIQVRLNYSLVTSAEAMISAKLVKVDVARTSIARVTINACNAKATLPWCLVAATWGQSLI